MTRDINLIFDAPGPGYTDVEEDGRPTHAADEPEGDNNCRESNDPEDIFGEEYLVGRGIQNVTFCWDDGVRKPRGHGKIGDGANEQGNGE